MNLLQAKELVEATKDLVRLKVDLTQPKLRGSVRTEIRKAVARQVHKSQFETTEKEISGIVADILIEQVVDMAHGLMEMEEKGYATKSASDAAHVLISQVANPNTVKEEMVNRLLPVMAIKMAEAAVVQMIQIGVDPRRNDTAG